jgi:AraC family transcriptional activator of tynA and feaB
VRVVEVAARWQFSNSSHFIRNFKAAYGISPASYARGTYVE